MKFTAVLSTLFLLATVSFALPAAEAEAAPVAEIARDDVVHHCGNGVDHCPSSAWTCCGPLVTGIGGTCRLLKPDEACIF